MKKNQCIQSKLNFKKLIYYLSAIIKYFKTLWPYSMIIHRWNQSCLHSWSLVDLFSVSDEIEHHRQFFCDLRHFVLGCPLFIGFALVCWRKLYSCFEFHRLVYRIFYLLVCHFHACRWRWTLLWNLRLGCFVCIALNFSFA